MWLKLLHPNVAERSCEHCQIYMYHHESGRLVLNSDGTPRQRPRNSKPPCVATEGRPDEVRARVCPKISPTAGVELNVRNVEAVNHYLECRAVGVFPDDPIVRRNAAIIRNVMDEHDRTQLVRDIATLMAGRR